MKKDLIRHRTERKTLEDCRVYLVSKVELVM